MNPVAMALLLTIGVGVFAYGAVQRWRLLFAAATRHPRALGGWRTRWQRLVSDGLLQTRVRQSRTAGWAHSLVFAGFIVLLARTVMLWGRGFAPTFSLWILGPESFVGIPLGRIYDFVRELFSFLVLVAVGYFLWRRLLQRSKRLKHSAEGVIILCVIAALMLSDQLYEGARLVLLRLGGDECIAVAQDHCSRVAADAAGQLHGNAWATPLGSAWAALLHDVAPAQLLVLAHVGLWVHSALVLVFLNWLPYSKHFHVLTALPNLFFAPIDPGGKLTKVAETSEELLEKADVLQTTPEKGATPIGISRVEDLSWKDRLDLLTCTECGRCTEHCPASRTAKPLSPMQLTLDLRGTLLASAPQLLKSTKSDGRQELVPRFINPETVWSCTTCRACEEQCPVGIGYVDKIVNMRRDLVLMRGEVPPSLQRSFDGLERHGNPWQLPRSQRAAWAKDLQVPRLAETPNVEVLYWVGCAASYDERAQRVARAFVALLQKAGVKFAILGDEETCTGDAARRAGNEYLFLQLANSNVETLNKYYKEGRFERIVTACPHCLTTLRHEYPDFGGNWPVYHHSQYLLDLVREGKLEPSNGSSATMTLHDPCTLSRYANDWISARQLLRKVTRGAIVEPEHHGKFTLCCGAGGGHMWMDEQGPQRMNEARAQELLATGAQKIVTACPFCSTMLSDGMARGAGSSGREMLDIAEVLASDITGRHA